MVLAGVYFIFCYEESDKNLVFKVHELFLLSSVNFLVRSLYT